MVFAPNRDPLRYVPAVSADLTYKITPNTILIIDKDLGRRSVTNDIEGVLRKIEYWHQGSIAAFEIIYRDENGVWDGITWDGQHPSFFAIGETDEKEFLRCCSSLLVLQGMCPSFVNDLLSFHVNDLLSLPISDVLSSYRGPPPA